MKHLVLLLLLAVAVLGCGGRASDGERGRHAGIFRGTLTDSGDGKPIAVEMEQHLRGNKLTGALRLTKDGRTYHGVLTGSVTGGTFAWTVEFGHADFGGESSYHRGSLTAAGTAEPGMVHLQLTAAGNDLTTASGALSKVGEANETDLSGTYELAWTSSLGDSGTVCLVVHNMNGQNTVDNLVTHLPGGGGYIIAGTVVGNTIASAQFSAFTPYGSLTHFHAAAIGGSGSLDGQTFGTGARNFSGTYTVTKQN